MRKGSRIFIIVKMIVICSLLPVLSLTADSEEPKVSKVEKKSIEREWGPEVDGIQISIQVEKNEFRQGDRIDLSVVIRNNRSELLSYADFLREVRFDISVKNREGEDVPLTVYGHQLKKWRENPLAHRKHIRIDLEPGEQKEYVFPINSIYDMSISTRYSITVSRVFGGKTITSNMIDVRVSSWEQ